MRCSTCGQENREEARFCDACGGPLAPVCNRCDAELRPGARFCDSCGAAVEARSPRDDPPPHLVRKILRDRERVEGERRTVTVLFADAVGFTPAGERLDPEAVYSLVQDCYGRMVRAVHRYEGTVNQFTGDGIMAIFGAPIAHEDSARRAVAAALEMQDDLESLHADGAEDSPTLRFRIGLNTGPVVVGRIGDDLAMEYTAVGDTTNLAARMQQIAEPGAVYVTEPTKRMVRDYFEFEDLGDRAVKGKEGPVHVHRALRGRAVRSRFHAAAIRGFSTYVGREQELSLLGDYYASARKGRGQVVFVTGEAGIGKSRLVLEFHRSLEDEDIRWLEGHSTAYGKNIPYLPVADVVQRTFAVEEADDEGRIIERVARGSSRWSPEALKALPFLRHLLRVDPGDPSLEVMDPRERRAGILDALRVLLGEESRSRPVVVLIEDVHWADDRSGEAIRVLAEATRGLPVLLLLTARPGYADPIGEIPHAQRLVIGQLEQDEGESLARNILQTRRLPPDLASLIASKADGNPLFIEEVTKGLLESGILRRSRDGFVLDRRIEDVSVPDTLQDVILSRIDRLEREAREALQLASVIGREFTVRLLARIARLDVELEGVLRDLHSLELIYEKSYLPELAYMFKHALTHDVAYSTLLVERRRILHRIVGAAIEELYADRLAEHYEMLAHHFVQGEDWERAYHYLVLAAEKSQQDFANVEAMGFLRRAIEVAERVADDRRIAEASIQRGILATSLAKLPEALADLERARDAARRAGDRHLEGLVMARRSEAEAIGHEFERAQRSAHAALEISAADGFADVGCVADNAMALVCGVLGRRDEARAHVDRVLEAAEDPVLRTSAGGFLAILENWEGRFDRGLEVIEATKEDQQRAPNVAFVLMHDWVQALLRGGLGEYGASIALLQRVIAMAERTGEVLHHVRALNTLGWLYGELEDHQSALTWNRKGLEFALAGGFPNRECESNARLNLADLFMSAGQLDEAARELDIVEEVVRNPRPHDRWMLWSYAQHLFASAGGLRLARGDLDAGLAYADECLTAATSTDRPKNIVKARRLRAEALARGGDTDGAEEELVAALEVARRAGNPPQLWRTHAALGEVLRMRGRDRDARHAFRSSAEVVDRVATSLSDRRLRQVLVCSDHVRGIREAVGAL